MRSKVIEVTLAHEGRWWIADDPDQQVPGILHFDPTSGARLELLGSFVDHEGETRSGKFQLILGRAPTGLAITLHQCFLSGRESGLPGFQTMAATARYVFLDIHLPNAKPISFKRMAVRYSFLNEWTHRSGFQIERGAPDSITVHHQAPEDIVAVISDDLTIKLSVQSSRPMIPPSFPRDMTIQESAYFVVEPRQPMPLRFFTAITDKLAQFLTFAVTEPVHIMRCVATVDATKHLDAETGFTSISVTETLAHADQQIDQNHRGLDYPFELVYGRRLVASSPGDVHPPTMLFTLRDI